MSDCTCRSVHLNGESYSGSLAITESCPEHGIGTEYYRVRAAHWNARLRELRLERDRRARRAVS